ncbi:helix-turn-helix transcriptional regulator [Bacillus wiedmannii]|uniref:helix-turn-helix transcriptional regulator n=1 Tax=Bacillus wiedmannii TaxID=1890302 RepID=UPI000BEF86E5|nr:helix-turn-helix transcriptional regulator [Bacillus wiedmannii]MDP1459696.1 helix-turn-helix transcriptional regulator [Bacillus wiedmannii]PEJ69926.1 transcriptional regulator [Bacillus wiedmannii]
MKASLESKTMIREYRESKDLTIKELSKNVKIPVGTLYDIETGRKGLKANKAKKMAEFLGVPIENLFKPTYYRALTIAE